MLLSIIVRSKQYCFLNIFTKISLDKLHYINVFSNLVLLKLNSLWKRDKHSKTSEFTTNSIYFVFPLWDIILQGQCQCIRDKFHVWGGVGGEGEIRYKKKLFFLMNLIYNFLLLLSSYSYNNFMVLVQFSPLLVMAE